MSWARAEKAALTKIRIHNRRFCITSFLQLESRTCLSHATREAHRPALILLFAKKFFRGPSRTGTYQRFGFSAQTRTQISVTGSSVTLANEVERSNILAPGFWFRIRGTPLLPAFTPECFRGLALGSRIQLQQRNCSRFTRDFSRRSTFSSSQRTAVRISGSRSPTQDLFRTCLGRAATNRRPSATIEQSAVRAP